MTNPELVDILSGLAARGETPSAANSGFRSLPRINPN